MTATMMVYDIPRPATPPHSPWEAFAIAILLVVVESVTGRRIFVCAACGCATAHGCAMICGDERIVPNKLTGILPR